MKKDKRLLAIPALLIVAAIVAWNWAKARDFRYAGTVEATEISLSPRISSTISTMTVQEGDAVHKGQVLVELGCEDLKLSFDIASREFGRAERLYKDGAIPFETYDRARGRRDDDALKVAWCRIESPIDGTVLARLREHGEWASPGVKLLTLADLGAVYAFIYVPQTELYRLRPGQPLEAFLPEAGRDAARRGTIAFIRAQAEFTPKNVQTRAERTRLVYGVKVALENADGALKPGMPVEVRLPR